MKRAAIKQWVALAFALLIAAWGHEVSADGIGGSGVVRYFGSVVIDGVHYQTEDAVIRINGRPAAEAGLKVGYHVSFRADADTLAAWSVDYYDTVAGVLESVHILDAELQQAALMVMGQRVEVDADTWLHGVTLDTLEPGMFLAVSADRTPDGKLLATSVDSVVRPENVLSGPIDAIRGTSIRMGDITIDAALIGLSPNGVTLAAGEWIHALGSYEADGTLYATRLVRQADRNLRSMPALLEGALRRDAGRWWIREHALTIPDDVAARLLPGLRASVSGTLASTGQLFARDIWTDQRRFYRLDGLIEALDPATSTLTVGGTRVLLDRRTSFRDDRDGYRWLGPDSLGVHDAVSLIVEETDAGVRARKVTRIGTVSRLLRAEVGETSVWRGPKLLSSWRGGVFRAPVAYYDGRRVPAWYLRLLVRRGDAMTVRFDADGGVVSADARSASSPN